VALWVEGRGCDDAATKWETFTSVLKPLTTEGKVTENRRGVRKNRGDEKGRKRNAKSPSFERRISKVATPDF